jgi:tetratricopeptide (TPR) repeat protein
MRGAGFIVALAGRSLALAGFAMAPAALNAQSVLDGAGNGIGLLHGDVCAASAAKLTPATKSAQVPAASVYIDAAVCYGQTERPADAEQILRKGLSRHPANPVLERTLAELLMHEHFDSAEAGQLLARAVATAPGDPEARHYYAQWAYMNSRERICPAQERAALRLPGLNDMALLQMNTLLGMCDSHIEDIVGARAAFERADEINLRQKNYDPLAAWRYVGFLALFGEDAEVQSMVNQILDRTPDFGPALLERAKYLDRSGQPEKAVEVARLVLESAGNDFNVERAAHAILAKSFNALGQTADAAREQAWIEAHPNPESPR